MQDLVDKAAVLVEALPYMRHFYGRTIVIKYGGHAMLEDSLQASFAVDVVLLKQIGLRPIVVHGGGPQIKSALEKMGRTSTFVDGLRVTDDATMEVVEMVLGGTINREIVERIQQGGGRAVGLTGSDGGLLRVRRKNYGEHDLGRVGEVMSVESNVLEAMSDANFIPVVAPIGVDADGLTHNINADEVAGSIAVALGAEKLILLTDIEGVRDGDGELLPELSSEKAQKRIADGTIQGGMIPKVNCCVEALAGGVSRAHIIDGRILHAVLLEIFTDGGVGTLLVP